MARARLAADPVAGPRGNARPASLCCRLAACAAFALAALVTARLPALAVDRVTLQLKWYPQFQFAGYYMAQARGFYAEEDLDVTLRPGWSEVVTSTEVLEGRAQFGVGGVDVLWRRSKGTPLVSLAAIFQHSAAAVMVRAESGIRTPMDLAGRTIAATRGSQDDVEFVTVLRAEGVDPAQVRYVTRPADLRPLIERSADAQSVYVTNEPDWMDRRGIRYRLIRALDYGIDFYGDTLFTTESLAHSQPGLVERFRRASIRGWYYALDHPDETIDYLVTVCRQAGTAVDRDHLEFEARETRQLIRPTLVEVGHQNPYRWERIHQLLEVQGLITRPVDLNRFVWQGPPPAGEPVGLWISTVGLLLLGGGALGYRAWSSHLRRAVRSNAHQLRLARGDLESRNRALHAMIELGHAAVSTRDVHGHVAQLAEKVREGAGVDVVTIYLLDDDRIALHGTTAVAPGLPVPDRAQVDLYTPGEPLAPVALGDTDCTIEDMPGVESGETVRRLAVPLRASGPPMGVLAVEVAARELPPRDEHVEQVRGFADEIALALDNAQLLRVSERQRTVLAAANRELTALVEFGRAATSAAGPLEIVREVVRAARTAYGFDRAAVFVLHGDTLVGATGTTDQGEDDDISAQQWNAPEGLGADTWQGILTGQIELVFTPDAHAHSGLTTGGGRPVHHHALVPLRSQDRVVGVLTVDNGPSGRAFSEGDARTLIALARHAATALQNAHLEAALRSSERQLRILVTSQSATLYIAVLSPDGRRALTYVSPQVEELSGHTPEAVIAMADAFDERLIHPADLGSVRDALREAAAGRPVRALVYRLQQHGAGERWVLDTPAVVSSQRGSATDVAGTIVDITDRRLLEEKLRDAQRLEAVGTLAGGIAHDFNNLLTIIGGNIEMALLDLPDDAPATHSLKQTLTAVHRAGDLTRQLLTFSRRPAAELRLICMVSFVRETVDLVKPSLGKGYHIELRSDAEVDPVTADPGQLQQVLVNLCVNARDAMPGGGAIGIEVDTVSVTDADPGKPRAIHPGTYVRLRVHDHGTGMDADTRRRIFDPFFTTKPVGRGTGLGLAVAYAIVAAHRGWIHVSSAVGRGTTFSVCLPSASSPPSADPSGSRAPITVLVADEDARLREELAEILEGGGFLPLTASSGPEAMALLWSHTGPVSLIVCSDGLPDAGALQLVRHVQTHDATIPVLVASHGAGFPARLSSCRSCTRGVIRRPYDREEVVRLVHRTLSD